MFKESKVGIIVEIIPFLIMSSLLVNTQGATLILTESASYLLNISFSKLDLSIVIVYNK